MLGGKANLLAPPMFYCALGGSAVPRWAALLASKQAPHAAGPAVLRWCNVGLHTAFVSRSTHSHMIRICPLQLNPWSADSMTARMSTLSLCFLTYPHDRSVPCVQLNPWSADSDSDDDQAFDAAARRRSSAGECCLFVLKGEQVFPDQAASWRVCTRRQACWPADQPPAAEGKVVQSCQPWIATLGRTWGLCLLPDSPATLGLLVIVFGQLPPLPCRADAASSSRPGPRSPLTDKERWIAAK